MSSPDPTMLETYFRLMNTNGVAQVYRTALDVGVLSTLETSPLSAAEVAAACGARPYPIELLLDSLVAMGAVRKDGDRYGLADVTRLLLHSDYRELGDQYWRYLPTFLQMAVPLRKMDDVAESEAHYQSQAAMLGWMLSPAAATAATLLQARSTRRGLAILDVGAGSAVWSLSLARLDAQAQVTAVDWPLVLEVATENAADFGLSDRLTTIAGNIHEVELPGAAFDLAIVANVTHLLTPQGNEALFSKLHRTLNVTGEIVVIDAFPGAAAGDVPYAIYRLGLALRTENGRVYEAEQLQSILTSAGFERGELVALDVSPHMVGMLVARKRPAVGGD